MLSPHASPPLSTSPLAALLALQSMLLSMTVSAKVFTSQSVSLLLVIGEVINLNLLFFFSAAGGSNVDASTQSPARVASAITVGAQNFFHDLRPFAALM
jgi:hypothetical protein